MLRCIAAGVVEVPAAIDQMLDRTQADRCQRRAISRPPNAEGNRQQTTTRAQAARESRHEVRKGPGVKRGEWQNEIIHYQFDQKG